MEAVRSVVAKFEDYHAFEHALRALKETGLTRYEAYGPTNLREYEEDMPLSGSANHIIAAIGAIIGLVSFYLMCVLSSLIYRLITGGKPPVSNLPFVIVSYEGTILLGALAAFFGALFLARLYPRETKEPPYDPSFSGDTYGIHIYYEPKDTERIQHLLSSSGALEINEYKE